MRFITDELLADIRSEISYYNFEDVLLSYSGSSNYDPIDVVDSDPFDLDDVNLTIFSNDYKTSFIMDDKEFITINQFLFYKKAILSGDLDLAHKIYTAKELDTIITLGNRIELDDSDHWEDIKDDLLNDALFSKFKKEELRKSLILTKGKYLVIRGTDLRMECRIKHISSSREPMKIYGDNLTGTLLMIMRDFNVFFKELY